VILFLSYLKTAVVKQRLLPKFTLGVFILFVSSCKTVPVKNPSRPVGSAGPQLAQSDSPRVLLSSASVINGSVFAITVTLPQATKTAPQAKFQKEDIDFFPEGSLNWKAIVPVSFMEKPGEALIQVNHVEYRLFNYSQSIRIIRVKF